MGVKEERVEKQQYLVCENCLRIGHSKEDCGVIITRITTPYDGVRSRPNLGPETRICHNCGEKGHVKATCTNEKREYRECFNCGETGHLQKNCTNPTNPDLEDKGHAKCFGCGTNGHIKKHCPDLDQGQKYFKCSKFGHIASDCPLADVQDREPNSESEIKV